MWQEYAIEPAALIRSLKDFNVFRAGLGWEQGRLLAKIPSDYKKLVREALAASPEQDIKKATIESRLQSLYDNSLIGAGRAVPNNGTWIDMARAAHAIEPFHAIITLIAAGDTFGLDDFDPSDFPWACSGDCVVSRTAAALSKAASRLFNHSPHVSIIDPHFAPQRAHVSQVLEAYLDSRKHPVGSKFQLSIHASRQVLQQGPARAPLMPAEFECLVRRKVEPMLRSGQLVIIYVWEQIPGGERFHDRYILCRHGGLSIQGGADTGHANESTTLSRVSATTAGQILDRFANSSPGSAGKVYDFVHKFEIN